MQHCALDNASTSTDPDCLQTALDITFYGLLQFIENVFKIFVVKELEVRAFSLFAGKSRYNCF
jgi:hypothetical protein